MGRKKVKIKLDMDLLRQRCLDPESAFHTLGVTTRTPYGPYTFIDRGGDTLAIAHLDFVAGAKHFSPCIIGGELNIFNSRLDDRLGAYVILDVLPKLGVNSDILLTTGEESGKSTGAFFETEKKYNWMYQFDRKGTDVVMYHYETKKLEKALKEIGFVVANGSFSDIAMMSHMGIKGFNFGVGYYEAHSDRSYMIWPDTMEMIKKFVRFYRLNHGVKLYHDPQDDGWRRIGASWEDWQWDDIKEDFVRTTPTWQGKTGRKRWNETSREWEPVGSEVGAYRGNGLPKEVFIYSKKIWVPREEAVLDVATNQYKLVKDVIEEVRQGHLPLLGPGTGNGSSSHLGAKENPTSLSTAHIDPVLTQHFHKNAQNRNVDENGVCPLCWQSDCGTVYCPSCDMDFCATYAPGDIACLDITGRCMDCQKASIKEKQLS